MKSESSLKRRMHEMLLLLLFLISLITTTSHANGATTLLTKQLTVYFENNMMHVTVETFEPVNLTIYYYNETMQDNLTAFESLEGTLRYDVTLSVTFGIYYIVLWQQNNSMRYEESYKTVHGYSYAEKVTDVPMIGEQVNKTSPSESAESEYEMNFLDGLVIVVFIAIGIILYVPGDELGRKR